MARYLESAAELVEDGGVIGYDTDPAEPQVSLPRFAVTPSCFVHLPTVLADSRCRQQRPARRRPAQALASATP